MRKKAEKAIRDAVDILGGRDHHRLDRIRPLAGLHPKVYDKTILDMERVGTIRLATGSLESYSSGEISGMVRRGETVFISFTFIDGTIPAGAREPEPVEPDPPVRNPMLDSEPVIVILQHLIPGEWERFERLCQEREGRKGREVLEDFVRGYLRKTDGT
ncbi:MAG: hypothetical protein ACLFQQ_14815 [Desulfococcaceae bacterium]